MNAQRIVQIDDYGQYVGSETVRRVKQKANVHVTHVNSTYYGGGVAVLLSSLTLLMNVAGIQTGWRVIQGSPDFFSITKKMHNGLQGGEFNLTELKQKIYASVVFENALQSHSAVVLQKSIREGFGLTVTEAMWKGSAVIGGDVGGLRYQIEDGVNGFLVSSVEQAAQRIVQLIKDQDLREELGMMAKETVKQKFLMIRLLEQYLDLLGSFETSYRCVENAR